MNILKELSIEIKKPNSLNNIIEIVNKMYYMNILSNVPNFNKLISFMKHSNKINVAVIGAGPVGLFLACYLFRYYNSSYGLNNNPRVNIIVFDNRLSKKGFKNLILEIEYFHSVPHSFHILFLIYILGIILIMELWFLYMF